VMRPTGQSRPRSSPTRYALPTGMVPFPSLLKPVAWKTARTPVCRNGVRWRWPTLHWLRLLSLDCGTFLVRVPSPIASPEGVGEPDVAKHPGAQNHRSNYAPGAQGKAKSQAAPCCERLSGCLGQDARIGIGCSREHGDSGRAPSVAHVFPSTCRARGRRRVVQIPHRVSAQA
jgi:hypothetical protein